KSGIAGYFRDPGVLEYERSTGILPGATTGISPDTPKDLKVSPQASVSKEDRQALEHKAEMLKQMLAQRPEFQKLEGQVEVKMTKDGLRIELIEKSGSLLFDSGSAALKPETVHLLTSIADEFRSVNNNIVIEGHSDAGKYTT